MSQFYNLTLFFLNQFRYYVKKVVSTLSALPSFLTLKNFKKLETRHIRLLESHGGLFPLFVGDIDQTIKQARSMAESYRFKVIELYKKYVEIIF